MDRTFSIYFSCFIKFQKFNELRGIKTNSQKIKRQRLKVSAVYIGLVVQNISARTPNPIQIEISSY